MRSFDKSAWIAAALAASASAPGTHAQTPPSGGAQIIESITVIGSRRTNASATDTPVPIDFIPMAKEAGVASTFHRPGTWS